MTSVLGLEISIKRYLLWFTQKKSDLLSFLATRKLFHWANHRLKFRFEIECITTKGWSCTSSAVEITSRAAVRSCLTILRPTHLDKGWVAEAILTCWSTINGLISWRELKQDREKEYLNHLKLLFTILYYNNWFKYARLIRKSTVRMFKYFNYFDQL